MSNLFKKSGKRILALLLLMLTLSMVLCACNGEVEDTTPTETEPAKYAIGVIQSDGTKDYESAYRGFVKSFSDKGYVQSEYHSMSVTECGGDKDKCAEAAQKYVDAEVDLIFAIGEQAAKAAKKATNTIPIIFCCVSDPIESKLLKSCSKPEGNITGVSDYTPVAEQIALIRKLIPDAEKVSAIYHTTNANSIMISTLAAAEAEALELEFTPYTATSEDQLKNTLSDALKDTDALYIAEDSLTKKNISAIIKAANKKKVPVFTVGSTLLNEGCLATCLPDYEDLGYNAGELSLICLKELHPISNIAVEYPSVCIDYINKTVAEKYSVDISEYADFQLVG